MPIPEVHVNHLRRHRTSMPNSLEKLHLVCVLYLFCIFLDQNEKNNQSPHWGRDEGILSSCPRFAKSQLGMPCLGLQILDTWMGLPCPSLNVVLDFISLTLQGGTTFHLTSIWQIFLAEEWILDSSELHVLSAVLLSDKHILIWQWWIFKWFFLNY